jgi:hypothetical protein
MEIDLIVKCPDTTCEYTDEDTQWYCSICGAKCKLTDKGYVKCSSINLCINKFIQYTDFICRCLIHKMSNRFNSSTDFLTAIAQAMRASQISSTYDEITKANFITNLVTNVNKNWDFK